MKNTRSNAIRKAARGQSCTLNIVGVCNYNPETTVLAHLPDETHGMGLKSDDLSSCFACSACHDAIDRRNSSLSPEDREFYMRRGMVRTWRKLKELEIFIVKN